MAYSYNPNEIFDKGLNQIRFELGDTVVNGEERTSPLCDEEYLAIIGAMDSWKKVRLKCLEAICMKFSYEVDSKTEDLSYAFSQRAERWRKMYETEKKNSGRNIPKGNPSAYSGGTYFYEDMHANRNTR